MIIKDRENTLIEMLNEKYRKYDKAFCGFIIYLSFLVYYALIISTFYKESIYFANFQLALIILIIGFPCFCMLLIIRKDQIDSFLSEHYKISSSKELNDPAAKYHISLIIFSCIVLPELINALSSFNLMILPLILILNIAIFVILTKRMLKIDYSTALEKKLKENKPQN